MDLSQPLGRDTQVHPFFNPPQILRELIHADYAPERPSFNAELIITSNHAATHVDAFGHYDRSPGAAAIGECRWIPSAGQLCASTCVRTVTRVTGSPPRRSRRPS